LYSWIGFGSPIVGGENCLWQFARKPSGCNLLHTMKFRGRGT
jgi:hypothetical protein